MPEDKRNKFDVERVNYFQGMMLVDEDFKVEQEYHRKMRWNHNLELHTWGVVRDLLVSLNAAGQVSVTEGLAIDVSGREVWWKGGEPKVIGDRAEGSSLVIEWNQEESKEYPPMPDKHLRLSDTAQFSWKQTVDDNRDLVLARIVNGQPDNSVRRNAASVRANGKHIEIRPVSKDGALSLMTGEPRAARLTVDADGNVGIGTSESKVRLHLKFPDQIAGNAAVLNLEGKDHVYMQWYPAGYDAKSPTSRKGWIGYGSANEKNLTIQNEYAGGQLILRTEDAKVYIESKKMPAALQVGPTPQQRGAASFFDGRSAVFNCPTTNSGLTPETIMVLAREGTENQAGANFARFDLRRYEQAQDKGSRTQLDFRLSHGVLDQEGNNTPSIMSLRSNGNVGIGTDSPASTLHIRRDQAGGVGPTLLIHNGGGSQNAEARIDIQTYTSTDIGPNFRLQVKDADRFGAHVNFLTRPPGETGVDALASRLYIKSDGNIGIGVTDPGAQLSFGATLANIKLALYETATEKYGLGIQAGQLRFHLGNPLARYAFFDNTAGSNELMTLTGAGRVGIGTSSPGARLDVADTATTTIKSILARLGEGNDQGVGTCLAVKSYHTQPSQQGGSNKSFAIEHYFYGLLNGWIAFNRGGSGTGGSLVFSSGWRTDGQDLAELFPTAGPVAPGDVIVFDEQSGVVKSCESEADSCVIGIASTEPAGVLGNEDGKATPVALCGRVPCNVDADIAPIRPGDLLTTSPTKGHAQKVLDPKRAVGAIIGKALGALEKGKGKITVLVALA